ncbi:MAG: hypothetical protein WEE89_17995 [Gemmatimonadota bacterium]
MVQRLERSQTLTKPLAYAILGQAPAGVSRSHFPLPSSSEEEGFGTPVSSGPHLYQFMRDEPADVLADGRAIHVKFGPHVGSGDTSTLANAHQHAELGSCDAVGGKRIIKNAGDKSMQPRTAQG